MYVRFGIDGSKLPPRGAVEDARKWGPVPFTTSKGDSRSVARHRERLEAAARERHLRLGLLEVPHAARVVAVPRETISVREERNVRRGERDRARGHVFGWEREERVDVP